ncbi:MAG TPA: hypothetical protein VHW60_16585 [Caulobacteraceae bacterium]|nr:hypothetical protein [Caulobacteraceae bacterium]
MACDLELAGFAPVSPDDWQADVVVRGAPTPCVLDGAEAGGPTWAMRPGRFLLHVPGIARFLLRDGAAIDYEAETDAAPGDLAAFLIGAAFGILLHQRGLVTVQASSVRVDGKAALFLGPSGAGKSTLAAGLARRGRQFLGDDFCVISLDAGGAPRVQPDGGRLKLWAEAIDALGLAHQCAGPVRSRLQKFHVGPPAEATEALPLGPAYALRDARAPRKAGIQRPNVVDAALLIRSNAYRPGVVRRLAQARAYFEIATAVGNGSGAFNLARDLDLSRIDETLDALEAHWAGAAP